MPTYTFDASNPLDSSLISAFPANERTMRTNLNSFASLEHALTGRHKLPSGSTATRDALADKLTGMWYFNTDTYSVEIWNGTIWATQGGLMRPGFIQLAGFNTVPSGWLSCDGAAASRTTYSALFAVISTNWGNGDGSTTFNVPDFRSSVPVGWHSGGDTDGDHLTIGVSVGAKKPTLVAANIPLLTVTDPGHFHSQLAGGFAAGSDGSALKPGAGGNATETKVTGITVGETSPTPVDNRQLGRVVAYLIKT